MAEDIITPGTDGVIEDDISTRIPIKQLYDEIGNPYFPITHVDLVLGDISSLHLGNIKKDIDLSAYLSINCPGKLIVSSQNDFVYFYSIDASYGSGAKLPVNQEIKLANNLPKQYRPVGEIVNFTAKASTKDWLKIWMDIDGNIMAKVTPRSSLDYTEYLSSLTTIRAQGFTFIHTKGVEA